MAPPPMSLSDYTVGWISAITTEYLVACELLDEEHDSGPLNPPNDNSAYTFGRMGSHYVVLACLPKGRYGLTSAASVAKDMRRTFPSLQYGLLVCIGGGAPTQRMTFSLVMLLVHRQEATAV